MMTTFLRRHFTSITMDRFLYVYPCGFHDDGRIAWAVSRLTSEPENAGIEIVWSSLTHDMHGNPLTDGYKTLGLGAGMDDADPISLFLMASQDIHVDGWQFGDGIGPDLRDLTSPLHALVHWLIATNKARFYPTNGRPGHRPMPTNDEMDWENIMFPAPALAYSAIHEAKVSSERAWGRWEYGMSRRSLSAGVTGVSLEEVNRRLVYQTVVRRNMTDIPQGLLVDRGTTRHELQFVITRTFSDGADGFTDDTKSMLRAYGLMPDQVEGQPDVGRNVVFNELFVGGRRNTFTLPVYRQPCYSFAYILQQIMHQGRGRGNGGVPLFNMEEVERIEGARQYVDGNTVDILGIKIAKAIMGPEVFADVWTEWVEACSSWEDYCRDFGTNPEAVAALNFNDLPLGSYMLSQIAQKRVLPIVPDDHPLAVNEPDGWKLCRVWAFTDDAAGRVLSAVCAYGAVRLPYLDVTYLGPQQLRDWYVPTEVDPSATSYAYHHIAWVPTGLLEATSQTPMSEVSNWFASRKELLPDMDYVQRLGFRIGDGFVADGNVFDVRYNILGAERFQQPSDASNDAEDETSPNAF